MKALIKKINRILKDRRTRRLLTRIVSVSAAVVVFVTTYALVLPAITMEAEAQCGIEAHQHDDSCYEDVLVCGQEESEGHTHDESCYSISQELICEIPEHQHDENCYDEDGNLQCQLQEHEHTVDCYKEVRELTCTLEESEGHHHTDACYEKNLICGKEVHTHSPDCYEKEAADAVEAFAGYTAGTAYEVDDGSDSGDNSGEDGLHAAGYNDGSEGEAGADASAETDNTDTSAWEPPLLEESAAATTTNVLLPEDLQTEDLSDGYVPQLDSLYFDAVLNDHTAFYYFHPEEGEEVPANSADITSWKPVDKDTELAPTDLVKAYLAYTIPAGSLNETNQIARYRLPANIHLTDDQILAINNNENGIAAGYVDPSTNTVLDEDAVNYHKYLGAEAVEGTRRPDQDSRNAGEDGFGDTAQEYISATVKAENVFDEEGLYGEKGAYLGQDLIFVFSPYTIEKNQTTYDTAGNPTAKGEKVTGWFAVDLNMEQIDWVEEETREEQIGQVTEEPASEQADQIGEEPVSDQTDQSAEETAPDQIDQSTDEVGQSENTNKTINIVRTTIVKSAEIIFAEKNKDVKASEISRRLKLVEYTEREEEADAATTSSDEVTETDTAAAAEDAVDETVDEGSVEDQVPDDAADADSTTKEEQASEGVTSDDKDQEAEDKDKEKQEPEYKDGSLTSEGDDYKITLDYTAEAKIPAEAVLSVREITAETDPEVYQACLDQASAHTSTGDSTIDQQASRFFDIEIVVKDEEGQQQKIEPEAPVSVNIQLPEKKDTDKDQARKDNNSKDKGSNSKETKNEDSKGSASQDGGSSAKNAASTQDPTVLHFAEKGVEQVEAETSVNETKKDTATEVQFQAESFSIYGVIYTVDFHWEVDGKTYEYSLAGGDSVSFRELLKLLHVIGTADDAQENGEQENGSWLDKITGLFKNNEEQDAGAEEFDQFINDIASVRFSDESLVKVAPITEETTAGALKDKLGLVCEYSAELSDAQRKAMDSKTFYPTDWALISLKAFSTEEYLTVEMKNGEKFQIRVTDAQIKKTVIDAKGDTWEITVTYGEDAQIPDGAELKVEEILPGDERYQEYYDKSAEIAGNEALKAGLEWPVVSGESLFDIEIHDDKGKIEPSAPVQVEVRLLGRMAETMSVVHFADAGPEALALREAEMSADLSLHSTDDSFEKDAAGDTDPQEDRDDENPDETIISRVRFEADSFSVYSVVKVDNGTDLVNDGPWTLVTGIAGDPGATTGYQENWGRDYFTIIVNANAMSDKPIMSGNNEVAYQAEGVHAWTDGANSYVGGEVPQVWNFERVPNTSDQYYIYVWKNGQKYYIDHHYGNRDSTSLSTQYPTKFKIIRNNDGTICIRNANDDSWYLCNNGSGEFSGRDFRFSNNGQYINDARAKFRLCKQSDAFDSYAARKVSVQDLKSSDNFLIYRKFVDEKGNEELYALAHDGSFVRVYDGGDTVYWRETDKNIYWNYLPDGNYYSIFTTNPTTHEYVYINPMDSSSPKQTLTSTPGKLTLIGKDNGEYGTTIENWDQTAYDYAGLHVTASGGTASLSTGTRVAGTSDEFLFAVQSQMPAAQPETVETVDSEALGLHITMYDYGDWTKEYTAGSKVKEMSDVVDSTQTVAEAYTPHEAHQLVKPYLEKGVPSSNTKGAMTALFPANDVSYSNSYSANSKVTEYAKTGVTNLFLKSYYDENGTFRYRSEDNFAYLGNKGQTSFTVYRQAATPYTTDKQPGHTYYYHGHFMPFNDIDYTQHVGRLMNQYGNEYTNGNIVGELPIGDGRTYEEIYGIKNKDENNNTVYPNFFTGMKMEATFVQPRNGKLDNGDDMVFKFTGDDDMWVYIDGVLVLDVGGIHEPLSGTINFATGEVTNPTGSSLADKTNLKAIFDSARDALLAIPENQRTNDQKATLAKIQSIEWKGNTFADYSSHDFKAFYMERGAGASNLDVQFNLKIAHTDEFVVKKDMPQGVDQRFVNQLYRFKATFKDDKDNNTEKPLFAGAKNKNGETVCTKVYYKDRKDEDGKPIEVPVEVDHETGYFYLRAGEAVVFKMADEEIVYNVYENYEPALTNTVEVNGTDKTPNPKTEQEVSVGDAMVRNRGEVNFLNTPFFRDLEITKHIVSGDTSKAWKDDIISQNQDFEYAATDVFEFRVYLESRVEVDGEMTQQLIPYAYGPYFVTKKENGVTHYYTLTGTNNAPVDKGTTPVVCSTTGRSGSINSIPPEFTVVIPKLAAGTHFYIEERRDNLPDGYAFVGEELKEGTYDTATLTNINRIIARDETDHQTFDANTVGKIKADVNAESHVYNKKVYVQVEKQWLKSNGGVYTPAEIAALPGSSNAVVNAELWKVKTDEENSEVTDDPVTVTFKVNTTNDSGTNYRQVGETVTVKKGSDLEFSLGARGTSRAHKLTDGDQISAEPEAVIERQNVTTTPNKITYSNGRQKDKWSKYTLKDIQQDTIVYATFDADKVGDDFVGLHIVAEQEAGSSTESSREKVADIQLKNGKWISDKLHADWGYTYYLQNVREEGLADSRYTFNAVPEIVNENGTIILRVSNTYREPVNITVEKKWEPALSAKEEAAASVTVELHRYVKKALGVIEVELLDDTSLHAPVVGAEFKLQKLEGSEYVDTEKPHVSTDASGKAGYNNLEPGTYKMVQVSTPESYTMNGNTTETVPFEVKDNQTAKQEHSETLHNTMLVTSGSLTVSVTDGNNNSVTGAKFTLYMNNQPLQTGLETGNDGTFSVNNLDPGNYYVVQNETPAGYKLPANTRVGEFTIQENQPGVDQHQDISVVNEPRLFTSVTVTLKKDSANGAAISGAQFELKQGDTVIATAVTDASGVATFNNVYEGNYTVHQVNTGSAGNDYDVAEDQDVTIQAVGGSVEPKNLTFIDNKAGNITVEVYAGQSGDINWWNSGNKQDGLTRTGLKPGDVLQLQITVLCNSNNESGWYCTNFDPTTHNGTWEPITSEPFTLNYEVPQGANDATYYIGVKSTWGLYNQNKIRWTDSIGTNSTFSSVPRKRIASAQPHAPANSDSTNGDIIMGNTGLRSGNPVGASGNGNATVMASSSEPPAGYMVDTFVDTYEIKKSPDNWQHTFENLDKLDPNGEPYYYYVVEKECNPSSYHLKQCSTDMLSETGTITMTNAISTGDLELTKKVAGNGADSTKQFEFTIELTAPAGESLAANYPAIHSGDSSVNTAVISNGKVSGIHLKGGETYTIKDLPSGTTYKITENDYSQIGYERSVTNGSLEGTIQHGTTGKVAVEITNTYRSTEVILKKTDISKLNDDLSESDLLKGAAFKITKYRAKNFMEKVTEWENNGSMELTDVKEGENYTLNGTFTFRNLPKGFYMIEETAFPDGYIRLESNPRFEIGDDMKVYLLDTSGNRIEQNKTEIVRVLPITDTQTENVMIYGNEPGAALPNSGGPGTRLLYLLGILLAGFAGAGLLMRKHRSPG